MSYFSAMTYELQSEFNVARINRKQPSTKKKTFETISCKTISCKYSNDTYMRQSIYKWTKFCGRQSLKNLKGCLPQILLGPFLNTYIFYISIYIKYINIYKYIKVSYIF